ncbi:MAG: hypothetical protein NTW04_04040, partial [Elusimicrobia bacterium]|nr:hypothetical protein [Elusimicrobiota bacterium]
MKHLFKAGLIVGAVVLGFVSQSLAATSKWVKLNSSGKLVYTADSKGNTVPDFSNVGYKGGGVKIPENIPVKIYLTPNPSGNDTARIQAAINAVGALPLDANGFRGAVLLAIGTYRIAGSLYIESSGVILRGSGLYSTGATILSAGRTLGNLIRIGKGNIYRTETPGTRVAITGSYVKFGSKSFNVSSSAGFAVGNKIVVFRPSTAGWIAALGMDIADIEWHAGDIDLHHERVITGISGNTITVDAPIVNSMEAQYGGGYIYKYTFPGRISQSGVENLRIESEFDPSITSTYNGQTYYSDENHRQDGIRIEAAENSWVRNVHAKYFSHACFRLADASKNVTVQDSLCTDPVSLIVPARRYSFVTTGQLNLVHRCYSDKDRHAFITGSKTHGPNVFFDSASRIAYNSIETHGQWATGILFDNIRGDKTINIRNNGTAGYDPVLGYLGQGWTGAQSISWNSYVKTMNCQIPPTARNYCIGGTITASYSGDAFDSPNVIVTPRSLYMQQLQDRLGATAVQNVTIAKQRTGTLSTIYTKLVQRANESGLTCTDKDFLCPTGYACSSGACVNSAVGPTLTISVTPPIVSVGQVAVITVASNEVLTSKPTVTVKQAGQTGATAVAMTAT